MLVDFPAQDNMRFSLRAVALASLAVSAVAARGSLLDDTPSRFVTLDGFRVHYKLAGRGRTAIVFVHGFGSDMNVWRNQIGWFARSARVVAVDLPGHGSSDKPPSDASIPSIARALRAVLDDARVDRAILVGRSSGTVVIRQFDRMFPWRTRALAAIDGVLRRSDAAALPDDRFASAMSDAATWKDDRVVVPLLVLERSDPARNEASIAAVRAIGEDVDYQTLATSDELNARLEKWLVKKKLLR